MMKLLRIYSFLIFVFTQSPLFGQVYQLTGKITSAGKEPLHQASVTLKQAASNLVLGYATTDNDGKFSISVKSQYSPGDLFLEANYLGYKKKVITLSNNIFHYDLILEESSLVLEEVVIKSRPKVTLKKDTITYSVDGFSRKEDRSIGDVLQRIPGFEIGDNGEIKFNNKTISNFYIDGDDILGGKYGIGTKAIPHNMVQNVQVYNNHEHIKALKDKNGSDKVAINLEIKDDAKLKFMGDANLGLGHPAKYDADINGILLNKNYKMLNVLKGNNIGRNLTYDVLDLLSESATEKSKTLVSPSTVAAPYIPERRYYNNNSGMLNANNFFKFKDSLQLKTNISILRDRNKFNFRSDNEVYTNNGLVKFTEDQVGYRTPNLNSVSVSAEKNKSNYYFKDELKFNYNLNQTKSDIYNQDYIAQNLEDKSRILSNNLSYIPVLGNNNTLYIKWKFISNNGPQQFIVSPGLQEEIVNEGIPYKTLRQYSNIAILTNSISANYSINSGKIRPSFGLDLSGNSQRLESKINILNNNGHDEEFKGGSNFLTRKEYAATGSAMLEYKDDRLEATLSLPVKLLALYHKDAALDFNQTKNYLLFNPAARLSYKINTQNLVIFKYNSDYTLGDISSFYSMPLFTNYRTLRNNGTNSLNTQRTQDFNIDYNIKKPIEMFFVNVAANYTTISSNLLISNKLTDNGILQQSSLPYHNQIQSYGANVALSKYVFPLSTTVTLKPAWNAVQLVELINDDIYSVKYNTYELALNADFKLFKAISIVYKSNWRHITNNFHLIDKSSEEKGQGNNSYMQSLSLNYSPVTNFFIKIEAQYTHISQKSLANINVNFADANFRLKVPKWKTDLELDITNIANYKNYIIYSLSNTAFINSQYRINPRMALLRAFFYFS